MCMPCVTQSRGGANPCIKCNVGFTFSSSVGARRMSTRGELRDSTGDHPAEGRHGIAMAGNWFVRRWRHGVAALRCDPRTRTKRASCCAGTTRCAYGGMYPFSTTMECEASRQRWLDDTFTKVRVVLGQWVALTQGRHTSVEGVLVFYSAPMWGANIGMGSASMLGLNMTDGRLASTCASLWHDSLSCPCIILMADTRWGEGVEAMKDTGRLLVEALGLFPS